jgi:NADH dehydrogenase
MYDVVVVGGGFAGVWSAAAAVRQAAGADVRVTLVSGGDDLVLRPRLYESDPGSKRIPLDRILGPIGVRRITATVTDIDVVDRRVHGVQRSGAPLELGYDKLVLATGSQLVRPDFPGAERLFDVDTLPSATALEHHLQRMAEHTAVVVGAGFTGIELATELAGRLDRVVLVDRNEALGQELGDNPRPHLDKAVADLGIERRLGQTVASIGPDHVVLSGGEVIPAGTVVWTAGMTAGPLARQVPGTHDRLGRLVVDEYLRVIGVDDVYAAGDAASAAVDRGHTTMLSCQHAQPMGKFAGRNVIASLLGQPQLPFAPDPYTTCLDLGAAGALATEGWDRVVLRTGAEAKELKAAINTRWIYPPTDDPRLILAQAARFGNGPRLE